MPAPHLGQLLWPIVKVGRWCLDRAVDGLRFEWFGFVLGRLWIVDDAWFGGVEMGGVTLAARVVGKVFATIGASPIRVFAG